VWLQHIARTTGLAAGCRVALARGVLPRRAEPLVAYLDECAVDATKRQGEVGLSRVPNAHWQFCLATTLGVVNHAHCVAARPSGVYRSLGATAVATVAARAFVEVHATSPSETTRPGFLPSSLNDAFVAASRDIEKRYGAEALRHVRLGLDQALQVRGANDEDILRQTEWLARLEECRAFAGRMQREIDSGALQTERETFVEPIEMCSTTHVHDDHRLVVIESGRMVFWAMPGMRLTLDPGDSVLVPKGRLHGSTVETDVCRYHQPILPDPIVVGANPWLAACGRA
jgi:hypothetical protein